MRSVVSLILLLFQAVLRAQSPVGDSLKSHALDEVVVTATRNERLLGALPMPVTLVSKSQIKQMGSQRLNDVLNEQTGLISVPQVNGIGNGLQLQGFDPDYTLILIDGEPLIGRTTGSLDLGRITVGNIRQIEIVKGPSSSLYGSDALAGVVNIITDRIQGTHGKIYTRYGTNNTLDMSGNVGISNDKMGLYLFGNRYSTGGYDLSPENYGKTVSPHESYTLNSKFFYKIKPGTEVTLSGRYYDEHQQSQYAVDTVLTSGAGRVQDWNLNPVLTHRVGDKLKTTARFYTTRYQTHAELHRQSDGLSVSQDDFAQTFLRPEVNAEYFLNQHHVLTGGVGFIRESVQTNRYGDENKRIQETRYAFLQDEWSPVENLSVIAGARYDHNNIYGGQLSPKFSAQYVLSPRFTLKGSMGVGFKAPDFRQLYLNFTNAAAGGYSVFGTEVAQQKLKEMDQAGNIAAYLFDPALLGNLKAERSVSYNLGAKINLTPNLIMDFNLFRNNVNDLIETQVVAVTTNNQSIYSYRNLNRVYTDGVETNVGYSRVKNFNFSVGYQLLFAKDKDKIASIKAGQVFRRDPITLESYQLLPSEYVGLYNRSRHMANFKVFYENKTSGYAASMRVIYRGRYGISSTFGNVQGSTAFTSGNNGNDVLDIYDNFVKGYALVNLSVAKTWWNRFTLQAGVDNLFNHIDPIAIPNLPGRLTYASITYLFTGKVKSIQNP